MMRTRIIDGKALAALKRRAIASEVQQLTEKYGRPPALGLIMVGNRKDSALYVKHKNNACKATGIRSVNYFFEDHVTEETLLHQISQLNDDSSIDGVLVQLPLPTPSINTQRVIDSIHPSKDVDGLHPFNVGLLAMRDRYPYLIPCTAKGILELLDAENVALEGKVAVVIGRSNLVGHPVAMLLQKRNATVIQCHSKTQELPQLVAQADVLVVACGAPHLVRGDWLKPDAIVIDVGINFISDATQTQRLVGDVCFEESMGIAGAITPVPGGVGPMTIAMLLHNVVAAFKRHVIN